MLGEIYFFFMHKKFKIFLEIAGQLNKYGIFPILYGSLGVARLIKVNDVEDIDIIVPDVWLTDKLSEFKKIMKDIGFEQDKDYPHEFNRTKKEGHVGFALKSSLKKDLGVIPKKIKSTEINGIKFDELSAKDYIMIYEKVIKLWEKRMTKRIYKVKELKKLLK